MVSRAVLAMVGSASSRAATNAEARDASPIWAAAFRICRRRFGCDQPASRDALAAARASGAPTLREARRSTAVSASAEEGPSASAATASNTPWTWSSLGAFRNALAAFSARLFSDFVAWTFGKAISTARQASGSTVLTSAMTAWARAASEVSVALAARTSSGTALAGISSDSAN